MDEGGVLNSSLLSNLNTVKKLRIKHCQLQSIAPFTFSKLPKLKKLIIDRTKVDNIPEGLFKDCENLEEIKIKHSTFGKFHPSTFTNLPHLRELNIENTRIGDLKKGMFDGCSRLEEFECDDCGIENIEAESLNSFTRLEELDLKNNKIVKFSFANLPSMPNLKTVVLSGNPITNIDVTNIQEHCPSLKKIKLKGVDVQSGTRQFRNMQRTLICGLFLLCVFTLTSSRGLYAKQQDNEDPEEFTISRQVGILDSSMILNKDTLKKLTIDQSRFKGVSSSICNDLPQLKELIVANTKIDSVPKGVFKNCDNLEEIRIEHSYISKVPKSILEDLPNLKGVHLEKSKIVYSKDGSGLRSEETELI
ncbi:hypothetical protein WA026_017976 [Henosepilachna vigintioctopunctata]|uniref:Uncharacterized protein n=1 Tax=Henosepilachna vigintioctopunctata TaxID=420089 RepID=A0AAW1TWL6_9CUCU